ncbi:DUF1109 domain-containing protein [bacterium]|nr:DUF1109 domain-containing protein [bacterium]
MNTEELIKNLTDDLPASTKVISIGKFATIWSSITLVFLGIALYWFGVGSNLETILSSPPMMLEAALSLVLGVLAAAGAFILSVPSKHVGKDLKYMAIFPIVLWFSVLAFRWSMFETSAPNLLGPMHCFWTVIGLAIIPGLTIFYFIRKASPLKPGVTGFLALTASFGLSAFVMRLACPIQDPFHQSVMHFLPVLLIGGIGVLLGKKLLKW